MNTFRLVISYRYSSGSSFQLAQWGQQLNSTGATVCCSSYCGFQDQLPSASSWDAVIGKSLTTESIYK